jgi:hypothetical protein
VAGFKLWLQSVNVTIIYPLLNSTTETISKVGTLQTFADGYLQLENVIVPIVNFNYPVKLASVVDEQVKIIDGLSDNVAENANKIGVLTTDVSALKIPPRAKYCSVTQTLASASWGTMSYQYKIFDNNNFITTDPTKITIKEAGTYLINAFALILPSTSGTRAIKITKNGNIIGYDNRSAYNINTSVRMNISVIEYFDINDVVQIYSYQDSGTTLDVLGGNSEDASNFSMVKIAGTA